MLYNKAKHQTISPKMHNPKSNKVVSQERSVNASIVSSKVGNYYQMLPASEQNILNVRASLNANSKSM